MYEFFWGPLTTKKLLIFMAALASIPLLGVVQRHHQEKVAQDERASVPTNATTTAMFLHVAWKSCRVISVPNIDDCAKIQGELPAELTAKTEAQIAINARAEYWATCLKYREKDACQNLIDRAWNIQMNEASVR